MRTVYGDHQRFVETYFSTYPGKYFTGDGARRDEDGYYWITGRVDDVINVSGHRLGTAEIESALVAHPKVAEAAVVGYPHEIKGQGIYCYVTLKAGDEPTDALEPELRSWVRREIGPFAAPGRDPVRARPAQDPLGQDHAPDPAQDRRGRHRQPRRHLDAGRPGVVDDLVKNRASPRRRRSPRGRQARLLLELEVMLVSHDAVYEAVFVSSTGAPGRHALGLCQPRSAIMASDVLAADLKGSCAARWANTRCPKR